MFVVGLEQWNHQLVSLLFNIQVDEPISDAADISVAGATLAERNPEEANGQVGTSCRIETQKFDT